MLTQHTQQDNQAVRGFAEFDGRSGNLVERALFNHRLFVVLACAVVTAVLTYFASSMRLNASFERMLPAGHPFIQNYLAHRADIAGGSNSLRIAVEAERGSIIDPGYLDTLRRLSDDVFLFQGVDKPFMRSLWTSNTRWVGVTEEGLDGGPVIPEDYDGSESSLLQVRRNIELSGEIGQLVAPNLKSSMVLAPLRESDVPGEGLDYRALSHQLEILRTKYAAEGVRLHITGFAKIVGDLIDGMRQVLLFFGVALLICTGVLYWYTRCTRSTILVVMCSLVAVVWQLGIVPLVIGPTLNPYSILVPFLVFAIGMSHGAQKMNGIMQDIGRGAHKLVAARLTFRRLFFAGLTALLADAVGFGVLVFIDIPVIQDLALTASIGVACLIFTNLALLPVLLSYVGVSATAAERAVQEERIDERDDHGNAPHHKHPVWAFLDVFTRRKPALIALLVAGVMGVVGVSVSTRLKVGDLDAGAPELRANSRYNQDNDFITRNYSASSDVYVVMVKTPEFKCVDHGTLSLVDDLEAQLQQLEGVEWTSSLAGLSKRAASGMNEGSLKWYELPRAQDMLNAIVTRAPRELFNQRCDLLTVNVYLRDHKADTLKRVSAHVEAFAREHNTGEVSFLNAAGNAGVEAATNDVVRQANGRMLAMVYVAVTALAFLTFRSWRAVACAILPLMLTSVLCEALMVWLNIGVKVATLPVIALGVGIGVDYALYILAVTLATLKEGMGLSEAYYRALRFTGKVVALTGIMLGVAVATWAMSPIKFQADMGVLLAFMFIWNMLGAGILVPALAHFLLPANRLGNAHV